MGISGASIPFDIGLARIFDQRGIVQADFSRRSDQAATMIAESVVVVFNVHNRVGVQEVGLAQIVFAGRVNVQKRDDRHFRRRVEQHVVTEANQHRFQGFPVEVAAWTREMQKLSRPGAEALTFFFDAKHHKLAANNRVSCGSFIHLITLRT